MDFIVERKKNEAPRALISNKNLPVCIKNELITSREDARQAIKKIQDEAAVVDFRSPEASSLATDIIGRLRGAQNAVEKARTLAKAPYLKAGKDIDKFVKEVVLWADEIIEDLSTRQKRYIIAQQRLAYESQVALTKKAQETGAPPPNPVAAIERIATTTAGIKTDGGSMAVKQVYRFKITDHTQVPRNFMLVNEKAVQAAIDAGIREISGIEIYPDIDLSYRTKGN